MRQLAFAVRVLSLEIASRASASNADTGFSTPILLMRVRYFTFL